MDRRGRRAIGRVSVSYASSHRPERCSTTLFRTAVSLLRASTVALLALAAAMQGPSGRYRRRFKEQLLGSLTAGRYADFVLLDQDIIRVAPELVMQTRVLQTCVAGVKVYGMTPR